jgi:putative ABC transport system ATP-binding protein
VGGDKWIVHISILAVDHEAIIKFEKVTKSYGQGETVFALNDVSLEIARGERVAVMGPSGSGKSTMLNLICGLDRPTSGSVLFDGQDLASMNDDERTRLRRAQVGMIFQTFNLLPVLSGVENVALPLQLQGQGAGAARKVAVEVLHRVGLSERMNNRPDEMSGGERQRVAIARALVFDPPVLLADEPTGNLDSHTGAEVLSLIDDLHNERNTTIVLVTHNELAADHCERRITLLDGRIEKDVGAV